MRECPRLSRPTQAGKARRGRVWPGDRIDPRHASGRLRASKVLEQSAVAYLQSWLPRGRRSSAASPPAACSELLRLHGFPCGGPLPCCRAPRLVAYRVDEDEQDGEEDGEEESEERDGDERRLNEKDPRKSEGQSLGYTDDALRA